MFFVLLKALILSTLFMEGKCTKLKTVQTNHKPVPVSKDVAKYLANLSNPLYTDEVLDNILIERVVGTEGHLKVFNYIIAELRKLQWNVDVDEFDDNTPLGRKTFKTIIGTLNPDADRYLVLACHFDSKLSDFPFVGATDSAVPCAMMLNLIKVLDKELKNSRGNRPVDLKLIFFDGEEAFVQWGPNDSIYGARHLAGVWENNRNLSKSTNEMISDIDKIDVLVLLDLIGHKGVKFFSFFDNTQEWFMQLVKIQNNLSDLNLLSYRGRNRYFVPRKYLGYMEDDHIPFLKRSVPILHLISVPFPDEWHQEGDNRSIVDMDSVEDINKILRIFVVEYLNVKIQDPKKKNPSEEL